VSLTQPAGAPQTLPPALSPSFSKVIYQPLPQCAGGMPDSGGARLAGAAGELVRIANGENGESFSFAAYLEFVKDGPYRGNHYHLEKVENMYVVRGTLLAYYLDLDTGERAETTLRTGDYVTVLPRCVHTYRAVEYSQVFEVANNAYDPADYITHVIC
jgi:quercetin dioxygenase-like cupin family protein